MSSRSGFFVSGTHLVSEKAEPASPALPSPSFADGLELTRFRGHLILLREGVHDAEITPAVPA